MASVIDEYECPVCGGYGLKEQNCRTFEDFFKCLDCGYTYAHQIKFDENGEIVKDENGNLVYEDVCKYDTVRK